MLARIVGPLRLLSVDGLTASNSTRYVEQRRWWNRDAAWRWLKIPDEPNVTPRPVRSAAEWQENKPLPGESFYQPALKPEFQIISQAMLKKENPRKKKRSPGVHMPPMPLYKWDWRDIDRQTGGVYTHKPLQPAHLEGKHHTLGTRMNKHVKKQRTVFDYFILDIYRYGPADGFYEERVLEIRKDPNRTCHIALCAGERGKRWIVATTSMKAGDIVRSTNHMPERPMVGANEGDAHPMGALAVGTRICSFEAYPGEGMQLSTHAGATSTITGQTNEYTIVKGAHGHEYAFKRECMAVVGQVSNTEWDDLGWGSPNMRFRFGYKARSGLWHRKDGYCGRKIHPTPPIRFNEKPVEPLPEPYRVTLTKKDIAEGSARLPPMLRDEVPYKWMHGTQVRSRNKHMT